MRSPAPFKCAAMLESETSTAAVITTTPALAAMTILYTIHAITCTLLTLSTLTVSLAMPIALHPRAKDNSSNKEEESTWSKATSATEKKLRELERTYKISMGAMGAAVAVLVLIIIGLFVLRNKKKAKLARAQDDGYYERDGDYAPR